MTVLPDDAAASISTVLLPFSTASQPPKNELMWLFLVCYGTTFWPCYY